MPECGRVPRRPGRLGPAPEAGGVAGWEGERTAGEFEKAVGAEEAGEIAGGVGRRGVSEEAAVGSGFEVDGDERGEGGFEGEGGGEGGVFGTRALGGAHRGEGGQDVAVEAGERGDGISREREDGRAAGGGAEPEGFAGALGEAVDFFFDAEFGEDGGEEIVFSFRDAAGEEDDVELGEEALELGLEFVLQVAQVEAFDAGVAGGEERGAEGVIVGAADLVRSRRGVFDFDEFVARRHDADTRDEGDADAGGSAGGGDGDFAGGEAGAGGDEFGAGGGVGSAAVDALAGGECGGRRIGEGDGAGGVGNGGGVSGAVGVFVGDDAVAAGGEDGAGGDFDAGFVGFERERDRAGGLETLDAEGAAAGGDGGVAESKAVHRDAVEGREIAVGADRCAEDAAVGGGERAVLGGKRRDAGEDEALGFGGGDQRHGGDMRYGAESGRGSS
jgi:hypothetical protein